MHGTGSPSPWLTRWAHLLPTGARVLDVACGAGRHVRWLSSRGHPVTAVDRDAAALALLDDLGTAVECRVADLEAGPWPWPGRVFDAVLVTHYLWRPLMPALRAAVAPGGWLIYETFAQGQQTVGRPRRAEFLLEPGELLTMARGWRVLAYEDGFESDPPRFVQRIVARRPAETEAGDLRLPLSAGTQSHG